MTAAAVLKPEALAEMHAERSQFLKNEPYQALTATLHQRVSLRCRYQVKVLFYKGWKTLTNERESSDHLKKSFCLRGFFDWQSMTVLYCKETTPKANRTPNAPHHKAPPFKRTADCARWCARS